ncbi:hypothetical protein V8F33_004398 [Rhypophila sp. PSN 637]
MACIHGWWWWLLGFPSHPRLSAYILFLSRSLTQPWADIKKEKKKDQISVFSELLIPLVLAYLEKKKKGGFLSYLPIVGLGRSIAGRSRISYPPGRASFQDHSWIDKIGRFFRCLKKAEIDTRERRRQGKGDTEQDIFRGIMEYHATHYRGSWHKIENNS